MYPALYANVGQVTCPSERTSSITFGWFHALQNMCPTFIVLMLHCTCLIDHNYIRNIMFGWFHALHIQPRWTSSVPYRAFKKYNVAGSTPCVLMLDKYHILQIIAGLL